MTRTGDVLGTLRFAAPEQLRGQAEPRSDVYSLGVTLYEMATLTPAFDDPVKARLVERVLSEEPTAPRRLDPRLPRDLETIILKASAKDPRHRYATAADLAADLRAFLDDRPIKARRLGPAGHLWRWCRRKPTLAASLAALLLLLVAVAAGSAYAAVVFQRQEAAARQDQARALLSEARALSLTRRPGQRFEALARLKEALALAGPDGLTEADRLAFRNVAIACFALPDVETVRTWPALDGDAHGWSAGFSFDATLARYAASDMDGAVRVRRVADDGLVSEVPGDGRRAHVFLSPDGTTLARIGGAGLPHLSGNGALTVWDVAASPARRLHALQDESCGYAAFSPDGRRLAWQEPGQGVALLDLGTGERARIAADGLDREARLAVAPDGGRVAFARPAGEALVCDARTGEVRDRFPVPPGFAHVAWHPDGGRLAVWGPARLLVLDLATGATRPGLAEATPEGLVAAFDRTGDLLATNDWSGRLRVWDAATGRQLLSFPSVGGVVAFARDADVLATQNRTYDGRLRLLRLERGTGVLRYAAPPAGFRFHPENWAGLAGADDAAFLSVVPDVSDGGAVSGFSVLDARTGRQRAALTAHAQQPVAVEPDGSLLTAGPEGIHRWPRREDGDAVRYGPPDPLSHRLTEPVLSRAGGGVLTAYLGGTTLRLWRPDGSVQRADLAWNRTRWPPAVSPDGRWLVTANGGAARDGVNARVYDTATGALVKELPTPGHCAAAFSPAGGWVWAGGDQARLWRVGTWADGPTIPGFPLAFAPDDRLAAVGDPEGAIRLVDPATGDELGRLGLPGQERLSPVAFTAGGGRLVAVTERGDAALIWDLARTRARLADLGLDWPGPPLPAPADTPPRPTRIDLGAIALNAEADRLARARKPADVIATWRRSLDAQPDQGLIHQRLAQALREARPPDLAAALAHADRAVALAPSVAAHQTRALIHEGKKDDRAALPDHDAALRLDPAEPSLYSFRGACRERLGDVAGALADARQAVALKPDAGYDQLTVARLSFEVKDYRAAAAAAERSLALKGTIEVTARWVLGLSRVHLGDAAAALPHLARVAEIQRGMPLGQIWLGLAIAQHHAGQTDAAKASHAKAVAWRKAQAQPSKSTASYDDLLPLAEKLFGPGS